MILWSQSILINYPFICPSIYKELEYIFFAHICCVM